MTVSELLTIFFPHLAGVCVDQVFHAGRSVRIRAMTRTSQAVCPSCGVVSGRVHSRYERRLADGAVGGQETMIHLQVVRFFCDAEACGKKTFAEQIPGLTVRYGRRSVGLGERLRAIAFALGGRAGARMTQQLAAAVSRMTLIRMIRAVPDPNDEVGPMVLGVDDFALRRGHTYGTVLVDMAASRPIDVLPDRRADTLVAWLDRHPGVQVICRDRAGAYADGATRGAPEAIQVADRWHMWRNLGEAVERTVAKHRVCLRNLALPAKEETGSPALAPANPRPDGTPQRRAGRLPERTRRRHAAVHDLIAAGRPLRAIARELGVSRNTVRRFARATDPDELLVNDGTGRRRKTLDDYAPYLRQRWMDGCTNAEQLLGEIRAMGYRGGGTALRQYVRPWRSNTPPTRPARITPTVRQAAGWILRNPSTWTPTSNTSSTP